MGDAHGVGLEAQAEEIAVPVVGWMWVGDFEVGYVVGGEGDSAETARFQSLKSDFD